MVEYRINGRRTLRGEVQTEGAKNAVLPILSATVLTGGKTTLRNCPDLRDVRITLDILRQLGCHTDFRDGVITVDSAPLNSSRVPAALACQLRSSITLLGPLLARCGEVTISHPGGDVPLWIPVDTTLHTTPKSISKQGQLGQRFSLCPIPLFWQHREICSICPF